MPTDATQLIPRRGTAVYSDGARQLTIREIQNALNATARLALFAAGRIELTHDEVESFMDQICDLMEVAHDAAPKDR